MTSRPAAGLPEHAPGGRDAPVLHPYAVIRVGGLPARSARLSDCDYVRAVRAEEAAKTSFLEAREAVCQRLAELLPEAYARGQESGRSLLRLKRDLFNGRPPASAAWAGLGDLPGDLSAEVEHLGALISALNEAADLAPRAYAAEQEQALQRVESAFRHPNLRSAIAATNVPLYRKLLRMSGGVRLSTKELNSTRLSLARYVLRSARKTSPLSSFGIVALANWSDGQAAGGPLADLPPDFERRRAPRFAALQYVFDHLLASMEHVDPSALVRLNSSVRRIGGDYEWMKPEDDDHPRARTRGVRLSRMSSDGTIVRVMESIFAARERVPIGAISAFLVGKLGADSEARVEALLAAAWQNKLIRPDLPDRDLFDAWWEAACACLSEPLRAKVEQCARGFLAAVAHSAEEPAEDVETLEARFAALLEAAGIDLPAETFRPLIFDDCVVPPGRVAIPRATLDPFLPELTAYFRLTRLISLDSPMSRLRRLIEASFIERFGAGGVCTDVRTFLEEIWTDIDAVMLSSAATDEAGARKFKAPPDEDALREELVAFLLDRASSPGPVRMDVGELEGFAARIPAHLKAQPVSGIAFGQVFADGEGRSLALNRIYPGTSRMVSRFLSRSDQSAENVARYLVAASPHKRPVELPGLFGFNASAHPTLTGQVLNIPPFDSPPDQQPLDLADMRLRHRPDCGDLALVDPEGEDVDLVYLGIVSPLWLPKPHQIIYAISFGADRAESLWPLLVARLGVGDDGTVSLPRMQVGGLVIVRAMTAAKRSALPLADLEPALFFRQFLSWADDRRLPRHLFFQHRAISGGLSKLPVAPEPGGPPPTAAIKPMPLDRHCPLSVLLFQRSLAAKEMDVVLVEALPGPDEDCFRMGGEPVAGELGIEMTVGG
ncbi:MAG TPA: lantibiotic dehydratase [Allosphingosinicella sp.]|nr:lantibiotic dehydratase [Allosphingosinicella sp.]